MLAAVQASVLRTDRSAAAGLDRVSAQRTREHLRDGQAETFQGCNLREFGPIQTRVVFLPGLAQAGRGLDSRTLKAARWDKP